jgi:hypothetical protein
LSIPPYLSTTWKNISSLHVKEINGSFTLLAVLQSGVQTKVPNLTEVEVNAIFEAHAHYAESKNKDLSSPESLASSMQHNPEQANLHPLPPDVLKKLSEIAKGLGLENAGDLIQSEPHCNCVYCQVVRALQGEPTPVEEEISDADLKFKTWDIVQKDKKLYTATNPLDPNEYYTVFLGEPLGCTCGQKNCEHIRAVLNT